MGLDWGGGLLFRHGLFAHMPVGLPIPANHLRRWFRITSILKRALDKHCHQLSPCACRMYSCTSAMSACFCCA